MLSYINPPAFSKMRPWGSSLKFSIPCYRQRTYRNVVIFLPLYDSRLIGRSSIDFQAKVKDWFTAPSFSHSHLVSLGAKWIPTDSASRDIHRNAGLPRSKFEFLEFPPPLRTPQRQQMSNRGVFHPHIRMRASKPNFLGVGYGIFCVLD